MNNSLSRVRLLSQVWRISRKIQAGKRQAINHVKCLRWVLRTWWHLKVLRLFIFPWKKFWSSWTKSDPWENSMILVLKKELFSKRRISKFCTSDSQHHGQYHIETLWWCLIVSMSQRTRFTWDRSHATTISLKWREWWELKHSSVATFWRELMQKRRKWHTCRMLTSKDRFQHWLRTNYQRSREKWQAELSKRWKRKESENSFDVYWNKYIV